MSALFRRGSRREEAGEPVGQDADQEPEAVEETGADGELTPRPDGPWDVSERPDAEGLVDLGALRLHGRDGMELRLEIEESSGTVTAVTVQLAGSAVQLQAFAAPRSEGIWDEIRQEISAGITRQGGTVDEARGTFGRELIARIPVRTPDGRTGHQPARFVGIDGPRWFLRAVFHGPAVYEPEAAATMEAVVHDLVVVRGPEAMAPRDLLPLRLPEAMLPPQEPESDGRAPLDPFRRGPEITEIR
ncbi:MAG TPA: DUF3710 domain-containing protein [Kineosporiaceae bacterium]|nr:DUF3710 domain-containing protein [Kineosporiaceae bacterium]